MNKKEFLAAVASDTIAIVNKGEYKNSKNQLVSIREDVERTIQGTILYNLEDGHKLLGSVKSENDYNTKFEVTNETTLKAVKRLVDTGEEQIVALNFASAKNPGGGFLKGSLAQEESLARASSLYKSISQKQEMYRYNRDSRNRTGMYSDYMIYSPKVTVIKDDAGNLLDEPYNCSFITSPAVNATIVREREPQNAKKIRDVMSTRIEKILSVALDNGHDTIILGAFGCGVFGNRPVEVAHTFKYVIHNKFNNKFKHIVFAIYDTTPRKEVFNVFKNTF